MNKIFFSLLSLFFLISFFLFFLAYQNFLGNKFYYSIFSLISFLSILYSFRSKGFFFEKFLSIYLWLGFWLKFTLFIGLFINYPPALGIENFDFSKDTLNELMILSSIPFISLFISSTFIGKINFFKFHIENNFLQSIYKNYRFAIIFIVILLIAIISITNFNYGIYQKGIISNLNLSYIVSGFYKWFYLIGSGTIISILLKFELDNYKKISNNIYLIILFESFLSSIAYLSRGIIFNASAIFYGLYKSLNRSKTFIKDFLRISIFYFLLVVLILISVLIVDKLRSTYFFTDQKIEIEKKKKIVTKDFLNKINPEQTLILDKSIERMKENIFNNISENFFNNSKYLYKSVQLIYIRFVGIDSLMVVSSYDQLNFKNLKEAFKEKVNYSNYNHYYTKFVLREKNNSTTSFDLDKKNLQKNQYTIHVPGIVAFLYYSGSKLFLFLSLIIISTLFLIFERFVYYSSSGNLILSSFISHIICYRLIHFGYVPSQSYLFFGSLIFTISLIFLIYRFLK